MWRFHAFSTTTDPAEIDTVTADRAHRHHAVIEHVHVHVDLKKSALAHMPSGHFCANAAWLVSAVMAFDLTRAAVTLTTDRTLTNATTAMIRRTLLTVPTRDRFLLLTQAHSAPTAEVAMGDSLEHTVKQHLQTDQDDPVLTRPSLPTHNTKERMKQPDTRDRATNHFYTLPEPPQYKLNFNESAYRWIQAK